MSPAKDRTILKNLINTHGLDRVVKKATLHVEGKKLLTIGGFYTLFNDLGVKPVKPFETFEEKHERELQEVRDKYANA